MVACLRRLQFLDWVRVVVEWWPSYSMLFFSTTRLVIAFKRGVVKMPALKKGTGTVPRTVGALGKVATAKAKDFSVTVVGSRCPGMLVSWNSVPVTGQTVKVMMNSDMFLQASML